MKNQIKSKVGVTAKIIALMLAANIAVSCTNKTTEVRIWSQEIWQKPKTATMS